MFVEPGMFQWQDGTGLFRLGAGSVECRLPACDTGAAAGPACNDNAPPEPVGHPATPRPEDAPSDAG